MPSHDDQQPSLYELFEQCVGLSEDERQALLDQLRESNRPVADSLAELLAAENGRDELESRLRPQLDKDSYKLWLQRSGKNYTPARASDLRELVNCFRWDQEAHHFFASSYRIGKCLSFNSLGATYFAEDRILGRNAVLFFPYLRLLASSSYRDSFLGSTKIISKIFHPNVATIFGLVEEASLLGVARQWIPGEDLDAWLSKHGSVTPFQIALITQRLAEGLAAIHAAKALHGDLKPANIIMPPGESITPVIIDFGTLFAMNLKGDTPQGASAWQGGTQGYIAPEVEKDADLDERLDLYSLGQVLRKLLMQVAVGVAADDTTGLRILADDLTKEDPKSRPSTASAVIDRLIPISGRPQLDAVAGYTSPQKLRPQLALGLWARRSVLATTATIVPYLLGRKAKTWLTGKSNIQSHFIPGDAQYVLQPITFKLPQSDVEVISLNDLVIKDLKVPEEIEYSNQGLFWGIKPDDKRLIIESEPINLPQSKFRGNMVRILVQCDAPPRSVSWELQVSSFRKHPRGTELAQGNLHNQQWIRLGYRDNYFGGLTQRDLIGTIDSQILESSQELKFRVIMTTKKLWDGNGRPPIMLFVKKLSPEINEGGILQLWVGDGA